MTDSLTERTITLDDFMQMERVEIVGGDIVEMSAASFSHARYGINIVVSLEACLRRSALWLVTEPAF